jgi:hypothetical protein
MPTTRARPRVFVLVRDHDTSGVSGTGTVAEGVAWSDGSASLRWREPHPSIVYWPHGVPTILATHGHNGATRVRYLDPNGGPPTDQANRGHQPTPNRRPSPPEEPEASGHHDVSGLCGCCGTLSPGPATHRDRMPGTPG